MVEPVLGGRLLRPRDAGRHEALAVRADGRAVRRVDDRVHVRDPAVRRARALLPAPAGHVPAPARAARPRSPRARCGCSPASARPTSTARPAARTCCSRPALRARRVPAPARTLRASSPRSRHGSAFLLTTFLPSQLLLLVVVYAVVLTARRAALAGRPVVRRARADHRAAAPRRPGASRSCCRRTCGCPNLAVLVHGSSSFAKYGERSLSLTGPLSYLRRIVSPLAIAGGPHWLTYVGIVPVLAIAGAWPRARGLHRRLLTVTGGARAVRARAARRHPRDPARRRPARPAHGAPGLLGGARRRGRDDRDRGRDRRDRGAGREPASRCGARGAFLVVWLFGTAVGRVDDRTPAA